MEVMRHYTQWTEDNTNRMTRKFGWNDITDAYWGKLPADWPYNSKVVDPRIRTSLIEKNARLLNSKLRGRLVPREGGDVLKARINNALLDFQWDNANDGGTMLEKWGTMDMDTRLYASKFALTKWRYEKNKEGEVVFNGNEFYPRDIRDCGLDPASDHVRNAKWMQIRDWAKIEDLDRVNDLSTDDKPMYENLDELKSKIAEGRSDRRDNAFQNRILTLKGLTDRVGDDRAFPVIELVTEYRADRWVTFAPRYKVIVRDIPNPYEHGKIPVVQLRYYAIQGDPIGESEVEPVIPLWRAIQAILCGYLDTMNIHMRPPLKIVENAVRIETIVFGPEAQWLMDRADAVQEHQASGDSMRYFQTSYQAAISAFNTAMGDTSLGVSAVDPTTNKRTATEIKNSTRQQNTRDQKNQTSLAEAIQDMMSMWLVNNRQFLFADDSQKEYILRIVGSELFNYFQRAGLDEMTVPSEGMTQISDIIHQMDGNITDSELGALHNAASIPKFPVVDNPTEKDASKLQLRPKMTVNDMGDGAEVSLLPEDLEGSYDYIPDVKSMASGAYSDMIQARQEAIEKITNPQIVQMLMQEGVKPNIKELLVSSLEDAGLRDADRFFTKVNEQMQQGAQPPMPMDTNGQPIAPPQSTPPNLMPDQLQQPQAPQPPLAMGQ